MIKVKLDKSIRVSGKVAVFLKTDYDQEVVEVVQSFTHKYYDRTTNTWELKLDTFPILLDKLKDKDIRIYGEVPKKYKKFLELLDLYDTPDLPYQSKTKPFEHQMVSFKYAMQHNKFLLADEQGLGKTKQALDIAVAHKNKMQHCLIVCGVNGLKWNWLNEISVHTVESGHILGARVNKRKRMVIGTVQDRLEDLKRPHDEFFLITNVETLRDKSIQKEIQKLCESGVIGMTIIDEIHKAKNSQSTQGKAIHCCNSYYKIALTGTPIMNNAIDLYNILKWLNVDNHTLGAFKNYYCVLGGFGGYEIVGYKNLEELEDRLNRNMLRRRKDDVLDLPPKIHTDEVLEMNKDQEGIYNEVHTQVVQDIDKIMLMPNPLVELTRLRQTTSNPGILTTKPVSNCKEDRILEILAETSDKVIVFSNWSQVINPLFEKLKGLGYNPAIVTGEIKDTTSEMNKFQNDPSCKVIVGTTPALGTGFTLTAASTVIFIDEPWTRASKDQAEDRAHRIGTKGTVNIITLLCKDTIDEKIHNLIKEKGELSDRLVDSVGINSNDIKLIL